MVNLLNSVSLTELVVILFMFALALKELMSIAEYFVAKIKGVFLKEQKEEDRIQILEKKIDGLEAFTKEIKKDYNEGISRLSETLEKQDKTLNLLIESDKDDIRGWIVQQYHYFMKKGSIDDFSKDTIEKRATHYFTEGGNSYVENLLEEIRKLPSDR